MEDKWGTYFAECVVKKDPANEGRRFTMLLAKNGLFNKMFFFRAVALVLTIVEAVKQRLLYHNL